MVLYKYNYKHWIRYINIMQLADNIIFKEILDAYHRTLLMN